MRPALVDIVDDNRTDKNTWHSYLGLYETLMSPKRDSAKRVLEIGVYYGGSMILWNQYFPNATIHGVELAHYDVLWDGIKNNPKIELHTSQDAYDESFVNREFLEKNIKFDIVIDDGPHTLISMIQFIQYYSKLLEDDGILIIEDVQDWSWIDLLTTAVPEHLKKYVKTYDLRNNKGRYDDIVFVIDKSMR